MMNEDEDTKCVCGDVGCKICESQYDAPIPTVLELVQDVFTAVGPFDELKALSQRATQLEAQLPDGMKHCTIRFRACEKGHGWLTATNWVQHGCKQCELELAQKALNAAIGFMENARIDLATGANKTTAMNTLEGGLKIVRDALK